MPNPGPQATNPANRVLVIIRPISRPGFEVGGQLIWGLTVHLTDGLLDLAGWQQPGTMPG